MSGESTLILQPGMATILAAFVGFLGGTIINHYLARRREVRTKKDEIVGICQGLIAEISAFKTTLIELALAEGRKEEDQYLFQRVTRYQLDFYRANVGKLGMLGIQVIETIQFTYTEFASTQLLAERFLAYPMHNKLPLLDAARRVIDKSKDAMEQLHEAQVEHLIRKEYIAFRKTDQQILEAWEDKDDEEYKMKKEWFDQTYTRKFVFDTSGLKKRLWKIVKSGIAKLQDRWKKK